MASITVKKDCVCWVLARWKVKSNTEHQVESPCRVNLVYSAKKHIRHQTWRPSLQHQHSDKSLKIKYKSVKELENGTPHKDVASLSGTSKNTLSTWKKIKKKSSNRKKVALGLKECYQKNMRNLTRD